MTQNMGHSVQVQAGTLGLNSVAHLVSRADTVTKRMFSKGFCDIFYVFIILSDKIKTLYRLPLRPKMCNNFLIFRIRFVSWRVHQTICPLFALISVIRLKKTFIESKRPCVGRWVKLHIYISEKLRLVKNL